MCGVAGAHAKVDVVSLQACLEGMSNAQKHRGPDADGIWTEPEFGLGFAHRRLSIIDLSEAGNQPMSSEDGRMVICFNGEIYNYEGLRSELKTVGYHFRSTSDTEVILAASRQWGLESALTRFVGMFAFALWDRDRRAVFLVRDRLGVKPIYYSQQGGQWAFASELKALRKAKFLTFDISPHAISLYLRYGYIPAPFSIYRQVQKVPAASIVELSLDGRPASIRKYWDLYGIASAARQNSGRVQNPEVVTEELESLLDESIRLRMVADVPVGAFLSGGIDSTTVVALMRRHTAHRVRTYTVGFVEEAFNEARAAREVARFLDTDHHEIYLSERDLLLRIDGIIRTIDEPFADISILPTLIVSELAASQLKVVLSGDGGDEQFCGYDHYDRASRVDRLRRSIPRWSRRVLGKRLRGVNGGSGKVARLGAIMMADDHEAVCQALISQWQLPSVVYPQGTSDEEGPDDIGGACAWTDIRDYGMLRDMRRYLPDDILHKVDRASMACGLEAREPLLDHRLIEYAWTMPLDFKVRNGKTKWPLRQILSKMMPETLYDRPKKGFAVPVSKWLRGELRSWADSVLFHGAAPQLFEMSRVRKLWNEHQSGARDRGTYLWTLLILSAWVSDAETANL
jgi:asparagine synthase (glutamine-hydrolysing)